MKSLAPTLALTFALADCAAVPPRGEWAGKHDGQALQGQGRCARRGRIACALTNRSAALHAAPEAVELRADVDVGHVFAGEDGAAGIGEIMAPGNQRNGL